MLSLISSDFFLKNSLSITGSLIYNINYIRNFKFQDEGLKMIFIDRDILSDIGIIKAYIDENHTKDSSPSFNAAISNLNETLYYLENDIHSLTNKIKNHHLKWFASYRSYDIEKEKQRILILIQQLNHRFELLIKIKKNN